MKNKYQEALDELERAYRNVTLDDDLTNDKRDTLQELVDKETPMKPIHLGGNKYSCKNCSMAFELNSKVRFVNNQYCDVCGQKIDWSNDE